MPDATYDIRHTPARPRVGMPDLKEGWYWFPKPSTASPENPDGPDDEGIGPFESEASATRFATEWTGPSWPVCAICISRNTTRMITGSSIVDDTRGVDFRQAADVRAYISDTLPGILDIEAAMVTVSLWVDHMGETWMEVRGHHFNGMNFVGYIANIVMS